MEIFLESQGSSDKAYRLPLASCAILYTLRYCQAPGVKVTLVVTEKPDVNTAARNINVTVKEVNLEGIDFTCIKDCDVPLKVKNCDLPVIQV